LRRLKSNQGGYIGEEAPYFGMIQRGGGSPADAINVKQVTIAPLIQGAPVHSSTRTIQHLHCLIKWGTVTRRLTTGKEVHARDEDGDGFVVNVNTMEFLVAVTFLAQTTSGFPKTSCHSIWIFLRFVRQKAWQNSVATSVRVPSSLDPTIHAESHPHCIEDTRSGKTNEVSVLWNQLVPKGRGLSSLALWWLPWLSKSHTNYPPPLTPSILFS